MIVISDASRILRSGTGGVPTELPRPGRLIPLLVFFGILYGAVMGSFGGFFGERFLQVVYSGLKVPLLLVTTFCLSLPSFFVINSLLGLRDDLGKIVRSLIATQAALTVILASLAPYTILWYRSNPDYRQAILFNGVMFAIASFSAHRVLLRNYAPLIAKNPLHRSMVRIWTLMYSFVGIQMGWVLRPFVGSPDMPTRFFREEVWDNAYVVIFRMLTQ